MDRIVKFTRMSIVSNSFFMKTSKVFLVPALTFWLVCLLLVFYLSSCGSNKGSATEKGYNGATTENVPEEDKTAMHDDHSAEHAKQETAEAVDAVAAHATNEKDEFVKEVKQQRDALQVKIDELEAKAEKKNDKAKADINKEVAQLEEKRKNLDTKLEALEAKTDASWQDLKKGVKDAADELDQSFEKIGNRFDK